MHVQQENNNAPVADEVDPELLAKVLANPEDAGIAQFTGEDDEVMSLSPSFDDGMMEINRK